MPQTLLPTKMRICSKNRDIENIKASIFTGESRIDDPIDIYSGHTLLHDAVIMHDMPLFEFLIQ